MDSRISQLVINQPINQLMQGAKQKTNQHLSKWCLVRVDAKRCKGKPCFPVDCVRGLDRGGGVGFLTSAPGEVGKQAPCQQRYRQNKRSGQADNEEGVPMTTVAVQVATRHVIRTARTADHNDMKRVDKGVWLDVQIEQSELCQVRAWTCTLRILYNIIQRIENWQNSLLE